MTAAAHVAVIGAGWAGLAAAMEAARRGAHVTLFEMAAQAGGRARDVVSRLFAAYDQDPTALPAAWRAALPAQEPERSRHLSDFIAGMTDRFAINQCVRIFGRAPDGLRNV